MLRLFDKTTNQEIKIGDEVTTFRGTKVMLISFSSTKVYVHFKDENFSREFYPSVINAEIIEDSK